MWQKARLIALSNGEYEWLLNAEFWVRMEPPEVRKYHEHLIASFRTNFVDKGGEEVYANAAMTELMPDFVETIDLVPYIHWKSAKAWKQYQQKIKNI
jgi:hypothetical protein